MSGGQWDKWRSDLEAVGGWDNEMVAVNAGVVRAMIVHGKSQEAGIQTVVETFERDEAQGFRSKDRQFAIEILRKVLQKSTTT